ncbi:two-component regulator propeller domain-containing protein [Maribacter confluentis]|uniref:histidine kinase n=1 Tax=Maribacter confluentis TaxID=1656093 RepID=A0ABT8RU48_9FLAO|nr:two-component regulator propeller domain-containing protein [Maribacter confluentis]MDO1514461.1 two-component regulator propeller domain-containing protein [Maribacter confluentis]
MKIQIRYIFSLLGCFFMFMATGQNITDTYNFFTIDEGIPKSAITKIVQDHNGLIWIATYGEGLYKYNGTDLKAYKNQVNDSTTIQSSIVNTLFLDSNNQIWVGTDEGLSIYNPTFDNFSRIQIINHKGKLKKSQVYSIGEDISGTIYVGTPTHGLYQVDPSTFDIHMVQEESNGKGSKSVINTLVPLPNGDMLIGSNLGLYTYDKKQNELKQKMFLTKKGNQSISHSIQSLLIEQNGDILIGTFKNGLVKVKQETTGYFTIEKFGFTDKRIFDIKVLKDNTILCATENDGLFLLDELGNPIQNYTYNKSEYNSIRSNSIWSIFVDNQERIWLGYYNKGIGVYDKLYDKFENIQSLPYSSNSLQSPSVTGIVETSDNHLYIAMDGGGIDKYDHVNNKFYHLSDSKSSGYKGFEKLDVQTLYLDSKENLWAGTWSSGIYFLPKGERTFINYNIETTNGGLTSNSITSFAEDAEGTVWIATFFGGLHSYDPINKEIKNHTNTSFNTSLGIEGHIRTLMVDHNDNIWIGGPNGLVRTNGSNEDSKLQSLLLNSFLSENQNLTGTINVRALYEDEAKNIWVGTYGKGLCKISPQINEVVWYTKEDGLLLENISSIIEDNNHNIWVSGETGLAMLETSSDQFSNYNREDGLLANNFNYNAVTKDRNGILYFGNYEGIDYFHPDNILHNETIPKVYFTDLKLFNKSVSPTAKNSPISKSINEVEQLTLKPNQFVFTLEFAAINFTRANNNEYAYYLEGFEDNWNYVGNTRTATYTNLSPGDYVFHVKASNNDGVWTESPLSLPITVLAPWWATRWAILGYLILTVGFALLLNWFLHKRIEERRMIKFERAQRQQEELLNEKKIQFFTNISHEFRTPLTLIINPIMDIVENSQYKLNKGLKEKHRIIYRNAQRLKNLIDELMDFRKLNLNRLTLNASNINAHKFVKEISEHFEEEAFEKNILMSIETDDRDTDFWGDPGLLEKILFNLLSNAFKATSENGVITISVYKCKEEIIFPLINEVEPINALEISIEDTGTGISKEDIGHIFERFYQASDKNQQYYGATGTGIGLELVQSFVQLHKGIVDVESEEGQGTKFKLFFPLGKNHLKASEYTPNVALDTDIISTNKPNINLEAFNDTVLLGTEKDKKTVLIVEDNIELRNYLKNKLRADYIVVEADNGHIGLQLALKGIPDIIITDIIMPEMDGFEFCKKIKDDLKTSHIPVLMLTAKAMSSEKVKGIDAGADAYLTKPFEMKVLRSYLKRLIENRQQFLEHNINDKNKITLLQNTTKIDKTFMQKVLDYVNENIGETDLNVEHLADDMSLSRSQLYRKIKAITGMTANELIRKIRLERAKQMIENGSESISEVGFKVGFSSPSYFSKCFKNEFGMLPTELKTINE